MEGIVREGYGWQARAIADAADAHAKDNVPSQKKYAQGVADALRVIAGDADPREVSPTFAAIYERYLKEDDDA